MALIVLFLFGIANFALHKAVLESGHRAIEALPAVYRTHGGRVALGLEFLVLLAAMLLAANGWPGAAWAYAIYSGFNALSAWLVLSGRL